MIKLFANEDLDAEILAPDQLIEAKIENSDIPNIAEFHEDAIQVAIEAVSKASNDMFIIRQLKASLENKKLSSIEYFTSIENYNLYMQSVSNNLGVSLRIPSIEDFKNPYGTKACHQFVMESFVEFIRSIWEKIKSFFKDFFKKIMLFFKRLTNANLEMEEYEQYIEDLMRHVKQSDKKNVEKIKFDSKLPSLVSDFGMQSMSTDYLLNRGRNKIENIGRLIIYITEKCLPDLEKDLRVYVNAINETFKKDHKLNPEEARESTSMLRSNFIEALNKNVFVHTVQLKYLPEEVYSDVMINFDREQLSNNNISFSSIIDDRDSGESLPNNFNLYLVNSHYNTDVDESSIPTNKLMIISNTKKNTYIENSMYTITNRDNLLKFYDFYKKFSKNFNMSRINNKMESFDNTIASILKTLDKPFKIVLENIELSSDDIPPPATIGRPREDMPLDMKKLIDQNYNNNQTTSDPTEDSHDESNNSIENNEKIRLHNKIRREFEYFERFMINYMNCIQLFLREFSLNIAATGQECRYEMIKLLYKSAKQF